MTALTHPTPTPEPINLMMLLPPECAACDRPAGGGCGLAVVGYPGNVRVTARVCAACYARIEHDGALFERLVAKGAPFVKLYTEPAQGRA